MRTGTLADTLGLLNPFRYRGYVYDDETQLYYLGSRYYNPYRGRFINADSVFDGANLFAYCGNNPINRYDSNGNMDTSLLQDGHYYRIKLRVPVNMRNEDTTFATRVGADTELIVRYDKTGGVFWTYYGTFIDGTGKALDHIEHYLIVEGDYYSEVNELCDDEEYAYYFGDMDFYNGCSPYPNTQYIMNIQKALEMTNIDGWYGNDTKEAVIRFQRDKQRNDPFMIADGITGKRTKWRLYHDYYLGPVW